MISPISIAAISATSSIAFSIIKASSTLGRNYQKSLRNCLLRRRSALKVQIIVSIDTQVTSSIEMRYVLGYLVSILDHGQIIFDGKDIKYGKILKNI